MERCSSLHGTAGLASWRGRATFSRIARIIGPGAPEGLGWVLRGGGLLQDPGPGGGRAALEVVGEDLRAPLEGRVGVLVGLGGRIPLGAMKVETPRSLAACFVLGLAECFV